MDKAGDWLFVTNSNADLRYNDGTLIALNLDRAAADRIASPATPPDGMPGGQLRQPASQLARRRLLLPRRTGPQPRQLRRAPVRRRRRLTRATARTTCASAALRPGWSCSSRPARSIRTRAALCDICNTFAPGDDRLLIGVRGDTSLTYVDVTSRGADTPPLLKCVGSPVRRAGRLRDLRCRPPHHHRKVGPRLTVRRSESARHPVAGRAVRARDRRQGRAAVHRSPERQHDATVHGRLLAVRHRADRCRARWASLASSLRSPARSRRTASDRSA